MKPSYKSALVLLFCIIFSQPSFARQADIHILVEDSYFPIVVNSRDAQGLAFEFATLLNEYQHEYNFIIDALPAKRFKKRVKAKEFDSVFLMATAWMPSEVQPYLVKSSFSVTVTSRFYALKESAHDQAYFDNFEQLTKIGVLGYSYKFAGFNTDEYFLNTTHKMTLTTGEVNVAKMILLKRADIGIMNSLAYQYLVKTNYPNIELIYNSATPDGVYDTAFLFNQQKTTISADKFDQILQSPAVKKKVHSLFSKYGLLSSVANW